MSGEGHALLLPFDTDDPVFRRGVEVGRIWTLLGERDEEVCETVHADTAEMLIRIGEATDRAFRAEELGNGWLEVTFDAR